MNKIRNAAAAIYADPEGKADTPAFRDYVNDLGDPDDMIDFVLANAPKEICENIDTREIVGFIAARCVDLVLTIVDTDPPPSRYA